VIHVRRTQARCDKELRLAGADPVSSRSDTHVDAGAPRAYAQPVRRLFAAIVIGVTGATGLTHAVGAPLGPRPVTGPAEPAVIEVRGRHPQQRPTALPSPLPARIHPAPLPEPIYPERRPIGLPEAFGWQEAFGWPASRLPELRR
jgi:hypothetical protein